MLKSTEIRGLSFLSSRFNTNDIVVISTLADWLKLYDHRIEIDSIQIRDVNSYGQKYITYITREHDELYQYVVVRGTKNWKNIRTSLKYTVSYNDEFAMHLHSGYGNASNAILNDLKQFIDPMARLRLTGHSYGGIVCCCIASHFQRNSISEIDQVVTFGMPQFSTTGNMNRLCNELPIIQVVHVRDEIAKTEWYRTLNRRDHRKSSIAAADTSDTLQSDEESKDSKDLHESATSGIVFIGQMDEMKEEKRFYNNPSLKKPIVHRMGDYVDSIEKHVQRQHGDSRE